MKSPSKVKIIDRIKSIFKLSQGEFVAPEVLENKYLQSQFIHQIFVFGRPDYSYLTAVVIPVTEKRELAGLKEKILQDFRRIAQEEKLEEYQIPRDIVISFVQFSPENGQLTGTLKKL